MRKSIHYGYWLLLNWVLSVSIEQAIKQKLSVLNPEHLVVENESHMHSVPENSETHFKLIVVSDQFAKMRQVKRHQTIYGLLQEELAGPVHALAIHSYTKEEWQGEAPDSPNCMGGSGK